MESPLATKKISFNRASSNQPQQTETISINMPQDFAVSPSARTVGATPERDVVEEVRQRRLLRQQEKEQQQQQQGNLLLPPAPLVAGKQEKKTNKAVVVVPVVPVFFVCVSCKKEIPEEQRVFRKLKSSSSTKEDWCWSCIKEEDRKPHQPEQLIPKYFLELSEWKDNGY